MMGDGDDDGAKYAELAAEMNAEDAKDGIDRPPIDFDRTELAELEPASAGREPTYQNDGGQQDDRVAREVFERHTQQHQPPARLPDMVDDPLGHFDSRTAQLEAMAIHDYQRQQEITQHAEVQAIRQHLDRADAEGRAELGEENFNSAMDHLLDSRRQELDAWAPDNSAHAQQLAQQNGYRTAADMRAAVLGAEIAHAAKTAAAAGIPLWAHAVNLARERGYQLPIAATSSERRQISRAFMGARSDKDAEAVWDLYRKVYRAEDDMARRPRR